MYSEDGEELDTVLLKFHQKVKLEDTPRKFVVVDAQKQKVDIGLVKLFKGSEVKVAFNASPYSFAGKVGLSLKLQGVQIIKVSDGSMTEEDINNLFSEESGFAFDSDAFKDSEEVFPTEKEDLDF
jgi:hypothetical protein